MLGIDFFYDEAIDGSSKNKKKSPERMTAGVRGRKLQVAKCVMCGEGLILMRKPSGKTVCWECQKLVALEQAKYRHTNEDDDPNKIVRIE